MDKIEEPIKPITPKSIDLPKPKPKSTNVPQKAETFMSWFQKNKPKLIEEFPHLDNSNLTKEGFARFKLLNSPQANNNNNDKDSEEDSNKKRKLNSDELGDENNQPKSSASSKLAAFARDS